MPADLENLDDYAKTRGPAYGNISFESVCATALGKTQMHQLRRLIGFKFKRHPQLNLPEKRLQVIERHIEKRVRQLLELQKQKNSPTIER